MLSAAVDDVTPTATPPPGACRGATPAFPVLDRAAFEDTAGSLSPSELKEHLGTLIARGEALLRRLRAPMPGEHATDLGEAAHLLGGSAGTFGFLLLAEAGHRFELAADLGLPETMALADEFAQTIDAAVAIMRRELAAIAT